MSTREMWADEMTEKVESLEKQVTILKADLDEAHHTRGEVEQMLNELLARIHRDGGQHVADYGVARAVEDAHEAIVAMHVEQDRTRRGRAMPEPQEPNREQPTEHPSGKNRLELARYRAGLSVSQAAQMFGLERDELILMERADVIGSRWNTEMFAAFYGVSVEWLTGQVPRYNYDAIKDVPGYDEISQHDRDVVAEFAASLPPYMRKKS